MGLFKIDLGGHDDDEKDRAEAKDGELSQEDKDRIAIETAAETELGLGI